MSELFSDSSSSKRCWTFPTICPRERISRLRRHCFSFSILCWRYLWQWTVARYWLSWSSLL